MRRDSICNLCAHNVSSCGHSQCEFDNDGYGYTQDCDDFEDDYDDDDDDDDDDDWEPDDEMECPVCGSDAYWTGDCYECSNDNCGWCGK